MERLEVFPFDFRSYGDLGHILPSAHYLRLTAVSMYRTLKISSEPASDSVCPHQRSQSICAAIRA